MFDYSQTLFVGIDVSKDSNQVCLINFERKKLLNKSFKNNLEGANEMKTTIISYLSKHDFSSLIIVLESTGIYSIHIANFLSYEAESICAKTEVYLLNPIISHNFSKSNVGSVKNDSKDAFALADFAASGKVNNLSPFRANQHFAIQSLVFATSIISELGDASSFSSDDAIAKYSGIYWNENSSGNFISEDNRLKKTGNPYLRYYLIEATSSVIRNNHVFNDFYQKKLKEVKNHKESRALVLTSRKFIRLIYKLLKDKKLYEFPKEQ